MLHTFVGTDLTVIINAFFCCFECGNGSRKDKKVVHFKVFQRAKNGKQYIKTHVQETVCYKKVSRMRLLEFGTSMEIYIRSTTTLPTPLPLCIKYMTFKNSVFIH